MPKLNLTNTYLNTTTPKPSILDQKVGQSNCPNRDKTYLAMVITVLPLWAILTTLIVFVLLAFHRNLRATKVYDNCTKSTAKFVYYIEMRTGETSVSYVKRKTVMSIDMFDENLNTIARIAIPGHVIFGKRTRPNSIVDDERYPELRVTRFWLYRLSKLKRVSTIRLTHSCLEPDAKIMVYGIQIKGDSIEDRLFFPIMNFISAYGSATKPNVCFDHEPSGTISSMGGSQPDSASITGQLSWVDYILLTYLLLSLIFYISSLDMINNSLDDYSSTCVKGLVVGTICYMILFVLGLFFRYIIKQNYANRIGTGIWAFVYYIFCTVIFIISSSIWILTIIKSYKLMCPDHYNAWLIAIALATILSASLTLLVTCISWIIQLVNPRYIEHYMFPDEQLSSQEGGHASKSYQTQFNRPYQQGQMKIPSTFTHQTGPIDQTWPAQYGHYQGANIYSQPIMMNPMLNSPGYKTVQVTFNPTYPPQAPPIQTTINQQQQQQQQQSPPTTYHQQTTTPTVATKQGTSGKKLGSTESTGSSYYQQLMKNRGGVKSISQYGELLRQKKAANKQTAAK